MKQNLAEDVKGLVRKIGSKKPSEEENVSDQIKEIKRQVLLRGAYEGPKEMDKALKYEDSEKIDSEYKIDNYQRLVKGYKNSLIGQAPLQATEIVEILMKLKDGTLEYQLIKKDKKIREYIEKRIEIDYKGSADRVKRMVGSIHPLLLAPTPVHFSDVFSKLGDDEELILTAKDTKDLDQKVDKKIKIGLLGGQAIASIR